MMVGPSFPSARQGDTTTHDLLVPCGVIGPPLLPPTTGMVMIDGLPAAHASCTVLCSGVTSLGLAHPPPPPGAPPLLIITGSATVFIHGMPAARWVPSGDMSVCGAFLGDPKLAALRTVWIGGPSVSVGGAPLAQRLTAAKIRVSDFDTGEGPTLARFSESFVTYKPAHQELILSRVAEDTTPSEVLDQLATTKQELAQIHDTVFQPRTEINAELAATRAALKPGEEMPVSRPSYKLVRRQLRTVEEKDPITRRPLAAQRGKYEGFVELSVLRANVSAYNEMRKLLAGANPDVILGTKRGGAFIADAIEYGAPALGSKIIRPDKTPVQADMYPALRAQIEQRILEHGDQNFVFVDCYMGGFNAAYLVDKVFVPLLEKHGPARPSLRFGSLWIREKFGLEADESTGRYLAKASWNGRIAGAEVGVPWIFGDDVDLIMDGKQTEPLHVYLADGSVARTIVPADGETTRSLAIRVLNGEGLEGLPDA